MIKQIFIVSVYLLFSLKASTQVGINTSSPQGVFHLHGTATDVIVDQNGNIGIGTPTPQAKIHIKTSGTSASPVTGLRIKDTNEGVGKVLTAMDNTGNAIWRQGKGSRITMLHVWKQTFPVGVKTSLGFYEYNGNTNIQVPDDGNYIVVIRWWGNQTGLGTGPYNHCVLYLDRYNLLSGTTTNIDTREEYFAGSNAVDWFSFTSMLFAPDCKKGDVLKLNLLPGLATWYSGRHAYPSFPFLPSVLIALV